MDRTDLQQDVNAGVKSSFHRLVFQPHTESGQTSTPARNNSLPTERCAHQNNQQGLPTKTTSKPARPAHQNNQQGLPTRYW